MTYRHAAFYVMSGTGNTLRVATWMAEAARARGVPSDVHLVEHPHPEPGEGPEHLVCVAMPTHGFCAPWHMVKFLWRLPARRGTHAVCVATRAGTVLAGLQPPGMSASCTFVAAALLWLRGYRVRGLSSVNMPSNWMSLHWGLHPDTAAAIKARSRPQAERFVDRVVGGERSLLTPNNVYEAVNGLLLAPISLLYLVVGRVGLAKAFFANAACNGCGQCVKACPVGGVELRGEAPGRPFWTTSCESCMRCMAWCPRRAVEAGQSWLVVTGVLSVLPFVPLWGWLQTAGAAFLPLSVLLYVVFTYVGCVGLYLLFHRALASRTVNALFTYTTLTHWYRRSHEPETSLRALMPPRSRRPADSGDSAA